MQIPKITVIEKPANHARRDLACALRVELMSGRELKTAISAGQRGRETA